MNLEKYHRGTLGLAIIGSLITLIWVYMYFTQAATIGLSEWDVFGFAVTWNVISTYVFVVLSFFALLGVLALAKDSAKSELRNTYFGLLIAWFFFLLGESTWFVYANLLNVDPPYPSIGDLFWAIGTILLIEELVSLTPVIGHKFKKKHLLQVYVITGAFIVLIIYLTFGEVLLARFEEGYTPLQKAFDLFYFIGDILILYASIYLVYGILQSKGQNPLGNFPIAWILLTIGMTFMIIGDTTFSYFAWSGIDTWLGFFNLYDLFYLLQYIFWILAIAAFPKVGITSSESSIELGSPMNEDQKVEMSLSSIKAESADNTQASNPAEPVDDTQASNEPENTTDGESTID